MLISYEKYAVIQVVADLLVFTIALLPCNHCAIKSLERLV